MFILVSSMKKRIIKYFLVVLFLAIISYLTINIFGKTYTLKINNYTFNDIDKVNIIISKDIIEIKNKEIKNGALELKFKSVSPGKVNVDIRCGDYVYYSTFYINKNGVINNEYKLGDSTYDEIIPISIIVLLILILFDLIKEYKKNIKENLYQYKNISYLSIIIFLIFVLLNNINQLFDYKGLYSTFESIIGNISTFSIILFPIALITFILVTFSNIKLLIKEGFSWKNMLGIILGVFLCFLTLFPEFFYRFTYNDYLINIHQYGSVDYFIYNFVESLIYLIVTYLECILIATIIVSLKSARRIPEFNKDYIIVLGCMINKDGSLTNLLKSRVDRAIEFRNMQLEKTNKDLIFVCSGGQGSDEVISEGLAMKKYLLKKSIKEKNIILEDKSTSTYENMKFSNKLIKAKSNIAYSTTNYHVFRAGVEASSLNMKVEGIGAKTKAYFWINAFIREFIATLYSEKKKHIIVLIIIILLSIFIFRIMYLSLH